MSDPRQLHRSTTRVLSLAMIAIGIALVVRTIAAGGGGLALGLILGVLFVAAGAARIYLQTRQERDS
jgi:multisubunit Na+/H+ antiporter MnhB subunit